jgi:hypothetical protein
MLLVFGLVLIVHGFFSKNMRVKDSRTWDGFWTGKIAKKRWQAVWMRTLFVGIGLAAIEFALTFRR